MTGRRPREECEEGGDECVDGRRRRTGLARFGVPGEYLVEFFEIDVGEVILEAQGHPTVVRTGRSESSKGRIEKGIWIEITTAVRLSWSKHRYTLDKVRNPSLNASIIGGWH